MKAQCNILPNDVLSFVCYVTGNPMLFIAFFNKILGTGFIEKSASCSVAGTWNSDSTVSLM